LCATPKDKAGGGDIVMLLELLDSALGDGCACISRMHHGRFLARAKTCLVLNLVSFAFCITRLAVPCTDEIDADNSTSLTDTEIREYIDEKIGEIEKVCGVAPQFSRQGKGR
jgi:hypothetical protein